MQKARCQNKHRVFGGQWSGVIFSSSAASSKLVCKPEDWGTLGSLGSSLVQGKLLEEFLPLASC
jgi:hypothetical protein